MSSRTRFTLSLCVSLAAFSAHAQSRGPAAQYWVDLATNNASMPGMQQDMGAGGLGAGLLGSLMGGGAPMMGASGSKSLSAELHVRAHPSGVEGTHAIPADMNMGQSLLLLPNKPKQAAHTPTYSSDQPAEKPKGRILLYWGCGNTIRAGQPKVLDFGKQDYREFSQFFAGSGGASSHGVQNRPGNALWPNERDSKPVPDNASLKGGHAVSGDGVPASLKFTVGAEHDFLPKVQMTTKGMPKDGVQVEWASMQNAKGYFLHAQGSVAGQGGAQDMIFWSSSERPENGWSLMTYQAPAQIAKLLQQKVILPPSTVNCTVPKGIFDQADSAMLNMIAYGPELNLSHPERPVKAPAGWQPDWTARVRIKSTGMTMLGMQDGVEGRRSGNRDAGSSADNGGENMNGGNGGDGAAPSLPSPINILRGLFGS